jgi:hypothetical protein
MKQLLLTGGALLMTLSSASFAQPAAVANGDTSASAPPPVTASGSNAGHLNLRQQLASNLQQAGFTDIKIMPDSFIVQAKDKSGNPVTMFINPDSLTVLSADTASGKNDMPADRNRALVPNPAIQPGAAGMFADVPGQDGLSSKVVGLDVYNGANEKVGTIKDIAFDANGVKAYIVAVGGFLGLGDHYVAVRPSAISIGYDAEAKKWHAGMNTNLAQLKAAPEYKYSANYSVFFPTHPG